VVLGAHLPGLPPRLGTGALRLVDFDQTRSISKYVLKLTAKIDDYDGGVDVFDLGFTDEHAAETAALIAEAVAEQFGPHLARLDQMQATLLGVSPDDWEAPMTAHYHTFALRLTTDSVFRGLPRVETLALLARLHALAGEPALRTRFADLALDTLADQLRTKQWVGGFAEQVALEKVRTGDLAELTPAEHDEASRRFRVAPAVSAPEST
jgi:hypothetical protein